jgi:hypothetical protein
MIPGTAKPTTKLRCPAHLDPLTLCGTQPVCGIALGSAVQGGATAVAWAGLLSLTIPTCRSRGRQAAVSQPHCALAGVIASRAEEQAALAKRSISLSCTCRYSGTLWVHCC